MIARLFSATALATLLATAASAQTAVPIGHFEDVQLHGGGHVMLVYGAQQGVTLLQGSTQYTHFEVQDGHQLVIEACNEDCPRNYEPDIQITTPEIHGVAVRGGGHIGVAPGFPAQDHISAAVRGGGSVDTRNLTVLAGNAAVDGGGTIEIKATSALNAAVDGGGRIRYSGNPSVASAIKGGGNVSREGE
jgi:hypothetical protein